MLSRSCAEHHDRPIRYHSGTFRRWPLLGRIHEDFPMISAEPLRRALPSGNGPSACRRPASRPKSGAAGEGSLYCAVMGMATTRPLMAILPKLHTVIGKGIKVGAREPAVRSS